MPRKGLTETIKPMRMKTLTAIALMSAAAPLLGGCGVGNLMNRQRPDEFAVQRQAPLVIPPDFALAPPQPGAPRPAAHSAEYETLQVMFGGTAPRSDVERATLTHAGPSETSIRSTGGDPKTATADKGGTTRDIIAAPQGDGQAAQAKIN